MESLGQTFCGFFCLPIWHLFDKWSWQRTEKAKYRVKTHGCCELFLCWCKSSSIGDGSLHYLFTAVPEFLNYLIDAKTSIATSELMLF